MKEKTFKYYYLFDTDGVFKEIGHNVYVFYIQNYKCKVYERDESVLVVSLYSTRETFLKWLKIALKRIIDKI